MKQIFFRAVIALTLFISFGAKLFGQRCKILSPQNGEKACYVGANTIQLSATPRGGRFSGPGVDPVQNIFRVFDAGPGVHTIFYTAPMDTCRDSITIEVVRLAPSSITGITNGQGFCTNDCNNVSLTGTPAGGFWSILPRIPGFNGTFQPCSLQTGNYTATYELPFGFCFSPTEVRFTISNAPTPTITGITEGQRFCITDNNSYSLAVSPLIDGRFEGPGVMSNTFTPRMAGAGVHMIRFIPANNACALPAQITVIVNAEQPSSISGITEGQRFCVTDNRPRELTGTPAGGTFSGPGTNGLTFTPSAAGTGVHRITYSVRSNFCESVSSVTVIVEAEAVPTIAGITNGQMFCINDCNRVFLSLLPIGGNLTANFLLTDLTFQPCSLQTGNYAITYTSSNGSCFAPKTVTFSIVEPATVKPKITFPTAGQRFCAFDMKEYEIRTEGSSRGQFFIDGVRTGTRFSPGALSPGEHTLRFTAETCNVSDSVKITIVNTNQGECVPTCRRPTFTAGAFSPPNNVPLVWSVPAGARLYEVQMRPQNGTWNARLLTVPRFTYTGLTAGVTYEFRVKAFCTDTSFSDWSAVRTVSIPVPIGCEAPKTSGQSNITTTGATLSWEAVPGAVGYQLSISGTPSVTVTARSNTFTANFLRPGSGYSYRVRTLCAGNRVSGPSATYRFQTLMGRHENSVEISKSEKVNVYPNPSQGVFSVRADCGTNIEIMDAVGRKVFSGRIPDDNNVLEIDLTGLGRGVYVLKAEGYSPAKLILD